MIGESALKITYYLVRRQKTNNQIHKIISISLQFGTSICNKKILTKLKLVNANTQRKDHTRQILISITTLKNVLVLVIWSCLIVQRYQITRHTWPAPSFSLCMRFEEPRYYVGNWSMYWQHWLPFYMKQWISSARLPISENFLTDYGI